MEVKTIKERRLTLKITQKELSKKLNISASFMCDIEKGRRRPAFHLVNKIAEILQMNEHYVACQFGYVPNFIWWKTEKEFLEMINLNNYVNPKGKYKTNNI